ACLLVRVGRARELLSPPSRGWAGKRAFSRTSDSFVRTANAQRPRLKACSVHSPAQLRQQLPLLQWKPVAQPVHFALPQLAEVDYPRVRVTQVLGGAVGNDSLSGLGD